MRLQFGRNIGKGGRLLRFLAGLVLAVSGAMGLVWKIPGGGWGWGLFMTLLIGAGLFAMAEGAFGWCALRALGYRTRV